MAYEFNRQDVYDFASIIHTETNEKGDELFFKECPYCRGGRNHDKNTFSINLVTGAFKCFRSSCGEQGHFVELANDFDFPLDFGDEKYYKILPQKEIITKPEAIRYLESRGISEDIAKKYKITVHKNHKNVLVFPFIDEEGVMQFVKYRNTKFKSGDNGAKEWSEKGTKPILFGMAQCEPSGTLIITEGQMDSLSVAECGIPNAVSVPTGARGFTWLQFCRDFIDRYDEIIVFGDNEHGRITLVDDLQARLDKKIKVVRVRDYLGLKDANDILRTYGKKAIVKAIQNAEIPEIKNIKKLSKVQSVNITKLPKIRTGIDKLDDVIGGIYYGQVVLLSGRRGEGKSTLMSQIIANALEQGERVFVYSGELPDYHFKNWLDLQLAGKNNIISEKDDRGKEHWVVPYETQLKINEWYDDRAYIFDNQYVPDDGGKNESLLKTIERAIRQYDVRLICVDNLMTAMESKSNDLYSAQSDFVGNLKNIAMKYNVSIILVAHPKKTDGELDNDDVAGSADITNKVDTVLFYNRNNVVSEDGSGAATLNVRKNRLTGKLLTGSKGLNMMYNASCKRIVEMNDSESMSMDYGWKEKIPSEYDEGFYVLDVPVDSPF